MQVVTHDGLHSSVANVLIDFEMILNDAEMLWSFTVWQNYGEERSKHIQMF